MKQFKPQIVNGQLVEKLDLRQTQLTRSKPVHVNLKDNELMN